MGGVESKNYVLDAGTLIRNVAAAMRENLPAGFGIQLDVQDRLLPVLADTTQLRQVVVNLLSKARQAMPQDGQGASSYIESGEPLDLILTDITMPRVDGIAFG